MKLISCGSFTFNVKLISRLRVAECLKLSLVSCDGGEKDESHRSDAMITNLPGSSTSERERREGGREGRRQGVEGGREGRRQGVEREREKEGKEGRREGEEWEGSRQRVEGGKA